MPKSSLKARNVPLYVALYADLRAKLRDGVYSPGDLFPAESELKATYGVSRITVRSALDQLVKDGLLERYPGRGSYVRVLEPQPENCLVSFTQQMLNQGREPVTKLLRLEKVTAGSLEEATPFDHNEALVLIERLRTVDGEIVALVRSYVSRRLVPGLIPEHFAERGLGQSILYVLENHFNVILNGGQETLLPARVEEPESGLLGVERGASIILKICSVHDVTNQPVLFEKALWCAPQTQTVRRRGMGGCDESSGS